MSGVLVAARKKIAQRKQRRGGKKYVSNRVKYPTEINLHSHSLKSKKRTSKPLRTIHANTIPNSRQAKDAIQSKVLEALNKLSDVDTRKSWFSVAYFNYSHDNKRKFKNVLICLYHIDTDAKPLCRREYVFFAARSNSSAWIRSGRLYAQVSTESQQTLSG
eukprot:UN27964